MGLWEPLPSKDSTIVLKNRCFIFSIHEKIIQDAFYTCDSSEILVDDAFERYKEAVPPSLNPVAKEVFGRLLVTIFGDNRVKKKRKTCQHRTRKCT